MKLLLDTHVLLWALTEPKKLSHRVAKRLSSDDDRICVSVVSLWEICVKWSQGSLALPATPTALFPRVIVDSGYELLSVDAPHALEVASLPWHHRDPFDRMLAAQARVEGFTLVTRDEAFEAYSLPTFW